MSTVMLEVKCGNAAAREERAYRYIVQCRRREARAARKRRACVRRARTVVSVIALAAIMTGIFRATAALVSGV